MLKAGADPDKADRRGDTPLIHVAKSEYDSYVDALLAAGADPCIADRNGKLPLDHAPQGSYRIKALHDAGGYREPVLEGEGQCMRDMLGAGEEKALALGRDERRRIQSCLKAQGHDSGPADGVFGPRTRAAIRGWQAAKGEDAPATGHLTRAHADTLLSAFQVAGSGKQAGAPGAVCPGKESDEGDEGCWREVDSRPGCWMWNPYPQYESTVTWSGGCVGGKASGKGKAVWRWRKDGDKEWKTTSFEAPYRDGKGQDGHWFITYSNGTTAKGPQVEGERHGRWTIRYLSGDLHDTKGPYVKGKKHGHWTEFYRGGAVWEGPYVDGEYHGYWVRRGSYGEDWECWKHGERSNDIDCILEETESYVARVAVPTQVRSGPGADYEETEEDRGAGREVDGGREVTVKGKVGDWLRVQRSNYVDEFLLFVHASKLEEAGSVYACSGGVTVGTYHYDRPVLRHQYVEEAAFYTGELCNGEPNGKGEISHRIHPTHSALVVVYRGEVQNGRPHGNGTSYHHIMSNYEYRNPVDFDGEWREGVPVKGVFFPNSGDFRREIHDGPRGDWYDDHVLSLLIVTSEFNYYELDGMRTQMTVERMRDVLSKSWQYREDSGWHYVGE